MYRDQERRLKRIALLLAVIWNWHLEKRETKNLAADQKTPGNFLNSPANHAACGIESKR